MEKSALPVTMLPPPHKRQTSRTRRAWAWCLVPLALTAYVAVTPSLLPSVGFRFSPNESYKATEPQCVQPSPILPQGDGELQKMYEFISTDQFWNASVERLSGAVKIHTESFDDLGPIGEDKRWDVMYNFHEYLQATFPLIHAKLQAEKVNTHGLLYTWTGSDPSLKPTLLMAHQDTVPVAPETIDAWTHPPWGGVYDGQYVWGRGASDCKNQLIAVMETLELLLEAKFEPKRTIILSFGFDEECSGPQGAGHLASYLHDRYGDDGLAVIVDEGATFETTWGTVFAKPATAEKGYTDVFITVRMPGGHSSIPSDHTSIGVLSELVTKIESEQYRTRLVDQNPYYTQLQCGAEHAEEFPNKLKRLLARRASSSSNTCHAMPDYLAIEAAKQGPEIKYLMQTSQAVDVIAGGAKVNALPERVQVTVNHRVNIGETPQVVWDHLTTLAGEVAQKYNLSLHAFDGKEEPSSIMLEATKDSLQVAPVTPSDASIESPYKVLAGTVRALYGKEVIVTPGIMTGNTDTRYYWPLTKHIFRFGPGYDPTDEKGLSGVHTVNEKASVLGHVNAVKWFTLFVRNMDEAKLE